MVKLIRNGKNIYIRIPKEIIAATGLTEKNEMLVSLDKLSGKIIIEKI